MVCKGLERPIGQAAGDTGGNTLVGHIVVYLYQLGVIKGVWVATDFPAELRTKVAVWRRAIDDFKVDKIL